MTKHIEGGNLGAEQTGDRWIFAILNVPKFQSLIKFELLVTEWQDEPKTKNVRTSETHSASNEMTKLTRKQDCANKTNRQC